MKKQNIVLVSLLAVVATLVGCAGPSVERIRPDETRDLSGMWNDTDSRLVSEEMIADVLSRPWIDQHQRASRKVPVVIVVEVRNLSHEHNNVKTILADLEQALAKAA